MPDFARRAIFVVVGGLIYAFGATSFDGGGSFSPDNRLGAVTFVLFLAGICIAGFGIFGPERKRQ